MIDDLGVNPNNASLIGQHASVASSLPRSARGPHQPVGRDVNGRCVIVLISVCCAALSPSHLVAARLNPTSGLFELADPSLGISRR